jgi:hypothetical protein
MARIYSFKPRQATAPRGSSPSRGAAQIIIFPGIRYERPKAGGGGSGSNGAGPMGPKPAGMRR